MDGHASLSAEQLVEAYIAGSLVLLSMESESRDPTSEVREYVGPRPGLS